MDVYLTLETSADSSGLWAVETLAEYPEGTIIVACRVDAETSLTSDPRSQGLQCFIKVDPGLGIVGQGNFGGQYDGNNQTGTCTIPLPYQLTEESKIYLNGTGLFAPADPPNPAEGLGVTVRLELSVPST